MASKYSFIFFFTIELTTVAYLNDNKKRSIMKSKNPISIMCRYSKGGVYLCIMSNQKSPQNS